MSYRISYYETMPASLNKGCDQKGCYIEMFETEHEALNRARDLIERGEVHAVAVFDDCGNMLGGVRLQLKLGFTAESVA